MHEQHGDLQRRVAELLDELRQLQELCVEEADRADAAEACLREVEAERNEAHEALLSHRELRTVLQSLLTGHREMMRGQAVLYDQEAYTCALLSRVFDYVHEQREVSMELKELVCHLQDFITRLPYVPYEADPGSSAASEPDMATDNDPAVDAEEVEATAHANLAHREALLDIFRPTPTPSDEVVYPQGRRGPLPPTPSNNETSEATAGSGSMDYERLSEPIIFPTLTRSPLSGHYRNTDEQHRIETAHAAAAAAAEAYDAPGSSAANPIYVDQDGPTENLTQVERYNCGDRIILICRRDD